MVSTNILKLLLDYLRKHCSYRVRTLILIQEVHKKEYMML